MGWSSSHCIHILNIHTSKLQFGTPFDLLFGKSATYDNSRVFGAPGIQILVTILLINQVQDLYIGVGVSIQQKFRFYISMHFLCRFLLEMGWGNSIAKYIVYLSLKDLVPESLFFRASFGGR